MDGTFPVIDARLLLWINHIVAAKPWLYKLCLFLTDDAADILLVLTAAWLWLWPIDSTVMARAGGVVRPLTRRESRARLISFGVAAMGAYIVARIIAIAVDADRPFVTFLPVRGLPGSFDGLRTFGSFPSDHAALLAALPIAFFKWDRRLGLAWTAAAALLIVVRVGVGFHYPSDMLAGALLGMTFGAVAMAVHDRSRRVHALTVAVAAGFERLPHAIGLYSLLGLVGLEFAMHFQHVMQFVMWLYHRVA
ncbi:MAG: phosphatase PAP2 family protein [Acidobacteriota bacterium]|nr:phosphatase PAP2 family protein [Acidobacteriota bacterium]